MLLLQNGPPIVSYILQNVTFIIRREDMPGTYLKHLTSYNIKNFNFTLINMVQNAIKNTH